MSTGLTHKTKASEGGIAASQWLDLPAKSEFLEPTQSSQHGRQADEV